MNFLPLPIETPYEFGSDWPSSFLDDNVTIVGRRTTDERQSIGILSYKFTFSSPCKHEGSDELKLPNK